MLFLKKYHCIQQHDIKDCGAARVFSEFPLFSIHHVVIDVNIQSGI